MPGCSHEKAADFIPSEAGRHFDPLVVTLFLESLADLPAIQARYTD
jgi:response regulator RpfG family c-di-GMP phosphodiesterase